MYSGHSQLKTLHNRLDCAVDDTIAYIVALGEKGGGWASQYRGNPALSILNGYASKDLALTDSEHLGPQVGRTSCLGTTRSKRAREYREALFPFPGLLYPFTGRKAGGGKDTLASIVPEVSYLVR